MCKIKKGVYDIVTFLQFPSQLSYNKFTHNLLALDKKKKKVNVSLIFFVLHASFMAAYAELHHFNIFLFYCSPKSIALQFICIRNAEWITKGPNPQLVDKVPDKIWLLFPFVFQFMLTLYF